MEELGPRVSYIKSLFKASSVADANWDEYQISFMEHGGNYLFRRFMLYYNLRCKYIYKRYLHKSA
jgi:hypothetical protein